jgi:O-antigen ligase
MQLSKNWISWLFLAMLSLLFLGWQEFRSTKVLAILPWIAFVLAHRDGKIQFALDQIRVVRTVLWFSVAITLWIAVSESTRGISNLGVGHALQFLVWIPIYASVVTLANRDPRFLSLLSFAAAGLLIAFALAMTWQKWHLHLPRPPAFGHNVLVGSLCLGISCVAVCASRDLNRRTLLWIVAAIFVFCLVVSAARAPVLSVALSLSISLVLVGGINRRHLALALLPFVALAALLSLNWERTRMFFSDLAALEQGLRATSSGVRLDAWSCAFDIVARNPFFGISADGVRSAFNTYLYKTQNPQSWGYPYEHLHNDLLQLSSAYGLPAGILFILFLMSILSVVLRHFNKDSETRTRVGVVLVCAFALNLLFAGFTDAFTFWGRTQIALQAMLGTLLAVLRLQAMTHTKLPTHKQPELQLHST